MIALVSLSSPPLFAAPTNADADIARVQAYLDQLDTLRARFVQVASTGQVAHGTLYMRRPGKMRIDYDPPLPVEIVADGTWLIYHDTKLGQVSHLPLSATPAAVLLKPGLSLDDDAVAVTGFHADEATVRLSLADRGSPDAGELTLVLDRVPMRLREWSIVDAQGVITTVSLIDPRFGVALDKDLFVFRDPAFFGNEGR